MHGDTRGVFHLCRVLRSDLGQPEQNLLNVDLLLKKKKIQSELYARQASFHFHTYQQEKASHGTR